MRLRDALKLVLPPGLVLWRRRVPQIPDRHLYQPLLRYEPLFSPWAGEPAFRTAYERASHLMLLDAERAWVIWSLVRQAALLDGDLLEAGVYRGGSALMIWSAQRDVAGRRTLHLFDSFAGLPSPGGRDRHAEGDFRDTSPGAVQSLFPPGSAVATHAGWIPDTFRASGVEAVAFAHVDLDLEKSVRDACEFIYPRLTPGGVIVFDDYGWASCPGARAAVDSFFRELPETPLVLGTGQAIVTRLPA